MLRRSPTSASEQLKRFCSRACKRSSCSAISCRARPRLNCKPPLRGAFWLHSTAVFAGARDFRHDPPILPCAAITFETVDDTARPGCNGMAAVAAIATFRIIITCLPSAREYSWHVRSLRSKHVRPTTHRLLTLAPTDDGEYTYTCISYARKGSLSRSKQTKFPQIKFIPV